MSTNESQKTVLFISELPDNILDAELKEFFSAYEQDIYMIQVDRNQKIYYSIAENQKQQYILRVMQKQKKQEMN